MNEKLSNMSCCKYEKHFQKHFAYVLQNRPVILLKRDFNTGVFQWILWIFKNNFFYITPLVVASVFPNACQPQKSVLRWILEIQDKLWRNSAKNNIYIRTTHLLVFHGKVDLRNLSRLHKSLKLQTYHLTNSFCGIFWKLNLKANMYWQKNVMALLIS